MRTFECGFLIATALFHVPDAFARIQLHSPAGVVAGSIVDQTGASLAGTTVTIHDGFDKRLHETVSDATGKYRVSVPPGRYQVAFELIDFATSRHAGVAVYAGHTTTVDAVLHLSLSAEVTVTGRRTFRNLADLKNPAENLVGVAEAASQGAVTARQLEARPIMRTGEIVETVPGLIVSQHSGEGKANQFYLRGFNLDHGTDFATTVAGIPVNMPTHGHGQGYTDLNFLIPELVTGVQFKKGSYFADEGDFSAAGSININYASVLEAPIVRVGFGDEGWARAVLAVSPRVGAGHLLAAFEANHNDGPWERGDDYRKATGVLRYTRGDSQNGYSLTSMAYRAAWNSTDQVPLRAIRGGFLSRFGAIDSSDGGNTYRHSLSADVQRSGDRTLTRASGFIVGYGISLFSNFTYFLDDPANGDQFEQVDRRIVSGARASFARQARWNGRLLEYRVGALIRNDRIGTVGLYKVRNRTRLSTVREDHVLQTSGGVWGQTEVQWTNWLRTTTGLRADAYRFAVDGGASTTAGRETAGLVNPKLGIALGPWRKTEWYANAGYGFHSNDARGVTIGFGRPSDECLDPGDEAKASCHSATPLVRAKGAELGIRTTLIPRVQTTLAVWRLGLDSELVFVGDAGTTAPSRPSCRYGLEWSTYARLQPWLTVDADVAWSSARFTDGDPAGDLIPGAVARVASLGISVDRDRPLFGSLRWRYFGLRPLVEDGTIRSGATSLVNGAAGARLAKRLAVIVDTFNLLNARASDIDYFYTSRLPGEPSEGVADVHTHPAPPRTVRVALQVSY